jgi:hypothetical protein
MFCLMDVSGSMTEHRIVRMNQVVLRGHLVSTRLALPDRRVGSWRRETVKYHHRTLPAAMRGSFSYAKYENVKFAKAAPEGALATCGREPPLMPTPG